MKALTFLLTPKLFDRCSPQDITLCLKALKKCAAEGFSRGANLEALEGGQHGIYSMRINQKARLLLVRDRDRPDTFYVTRALMNHEYDKALRELPQQYDFRAAQELVVEIDEHEATEKAAISAVAENIIQETDRDFSYYRGDFITLTTDQRETVNQLHFPFIVSGAPGSGKSLIALEMLRQRIESHPSSGSDEPIHLLYITKSKRLALAQEALFKERCLLDTLSLPANISCDFKTFDQLYQEVYGDRLLKDEKLHCLTWLKKQIVSLNKEIEAHNKVSSKDKKHGLLPDADVFYQEFLLLSRFLVKADKEARNTYIQSTMGAYDSYFYQDRLLREKALTLFDSYCASLGTQVHTQFCRLDSPISYDMVLVDESQDVSLCCLYSQLLASNGRVVFLHGPHQNLGSNLNFTRLLKEMGGLDHSMPIYHLPVAFRNSQAVSYFLNAMLQCKYQLTGGMADKNEFDFIAIPTSKPVGDVAWKIAEQNGLLAYADNTHYAILYHAEQREALIRDFNGRLPVNAYTIEESKGLEFKQVFFWHPFSGRSTLLTDANSSLSNVIPYRLDNPHAARAKDKSEIQANFNVLMDGMFVACSRAIESLVIYEESKPVQRHMAAYFQQAVGVIRQKIAATDQPVISGAIEETEQSIIGWAQELLRALDTTNEKDILQRIQQKIDQLRSNGKTKLAQALSAQLPVIHSLPQVEKTQPKKKEHKKKHTSQTVIHPSPVASSSAATCTKAKPGMGLKGARGSQAHSSKPETPAYSLVKGLLSGNNFSTALSNIVTQGKHISVLLDVLNNEETILKGFISLLDLLRNPDHHFADIFQGVIDYAIDNNEEQKLIYLLDQTLWDCWSLWMVAARYKPATFAKLVDKLLETSKGTAQLLAACDQKNRSGSSLWMVAIQSSPATFAKLVDKLLTTDEWTAQLLAACDQKNRNGVSLWMFVAERRPATFAKLVDEVLEKGEWTAQLLAACDQKDQNSVSLWMVAAQYSPATFAKLVDEQLKMSGGAEKMIAACDQENGYGLSLWIIVVQSSPATFTKLVDKLLTTDEWSVQLIAACDQKTKDGASLWMFAAQYSPAIFAKLVDKVLEKGEWTPQLITVCDQKTNSGLSLWMVAAQHSPATFAKLVDERLKASGGVAKMIAACDQKARGGWSLWMLAARYSPATFAKLVDKLLTTDEWTAQLLAACDQKTEGGASLWMFAAECSPATFAKLVDKMLETSEGIAQLIAACDQKTGECRSLWMSAAQYSPATFARLVGERLKMSGGTEKMIAACDQKTKDGVSLWMVAAQYSPATLDKLRDRGCVSTTDDGKQCLLTASGYQAERQVAQPSVSGLFASQSDQATSSSCSKQKDCIGPSR